MKVSVHQPSRLKKYTHGKLVAAILDVPRHDDNDEVVVRPFNIMASDVDILVELKPEGKVCQANGCCR